MRYFPTCTELPNLECLIIRMQFFTVLCMLDSVLILILFFSPLAVNDQSSAFESLEGQIGDLGNTLLIKGLAYLLKVAGEQRPSGVRECNSL